MLRLLLSFLAVSAVLAASVRQSNIDESLARARALYDEGKFEESRQLLLPVDEALRSQPERIDDRIEVKLQLALIDIGLDQTADARNRIAELYVLDPDFAADLQGFSPAVVLLFEEVRSQNRQTCTKVCREADALLENADARQLLQLLGTHGSRCICLDALAKDAAEYFYQRGAEAQKDGDLDGALKELQFAGRFDPAHPLVASAIEAIQGQFKATVEKALQQWRADMAAGQFGLASTLYHQITTANTDNAPQILEQMRAGYRQHLAPAIQQWNEGCSRDDKLLMDRARRQAAEVLPDPEFGEKLIAEWMVCAGKP